MSDIALTQIQAGLQPPRFDISLSGYDLSAEDGLQTAVILSLFCDRRAGSDDLQMLSDTDRRGFWADAWAAVDGDQFGSRLWLLQREKQRGSVLVRAREYAVESLQWLIDDGVASAVDVMPTWLRPGVLSLSVVITRGDQKLVYDHIWRGALHAV